MSNQQAFFQPQEAQIWEILANNATPSAEQIHTILQKSLKLEKLNLAEIACLLQCQTPALLSEIYAAALAVKNLIYGQRIVFFAPLYISNLCLNDCLYCAFRAENTQIARKSLNPSEIIHETEALLTQGHKRVLMVAGESYPSDQGLKYVLDAVGHIYSARVGDHRIRRVNVNIAPLTTPEFRLLKEAQIGTYQLFQETYHLATYQQMHQHGPKADYANRLAAIDRAFEVGIDDVGLGVLFGLADWRFEVLALMQHVAHLEKKFGMGPHTISVPRLEPADGSTVAEHPPQLVSDENFKKIVAVLRLAVPYTGLILSTRENMTTRREVLQLGISQISAGSRTNPGGYGEDTAASGGQFSLGDHRSLDEVIYDLLQMDFLPSFCTSCYRLGRTGLDFMSYAKPGEIKKKCFPNAMVTFQEYLLDFATPPTKELGLKKLQEWLAAVDDPKIQLYLKKALVQLTDGQRDLYV